MIGLFWTLAAAVSGPFGSADLNAVPIDYRPLSPADLRVPVGNSVRAATWDNLAATPSEATRVQLACIVWNISGAPGACVPASLLPPHQKTIDWIGLRDRAEQADRSDAPAMVELRGVAGRRIHTAHLPATPGQKHMFVIRIFEETISPTDAREPFSPGPSLTLNEARLAQPLDGSLVQHLYPTAAVRAGIIARVVVTCKIEFTLRPLCRDSGAFQLDPTSVNSLTPEIREDLLFATYQLASTMKLEPKANDGRDVRGLNLRIAVTWRMPEP